MFHADSHPDDKSIWFLLCLLQMLVVELGVDGSIAFDDGGRGLNDEIHG